MTENTDLESKKAFMKGDIKNEINPFLLHNLQVVSHSCVNNQRKENLKKAFTQLPFL